MDVGLRPGLGGLFLSRGLLSGHGCSGLSPSDLGFIDGLLFAFSFSRPMFGNAPEQQTRSRSDGGSLPGLSMVLVSNHGAGDPSQGSPGQGIIRATRGGGLPVVSTRVAIVRILVVGIVRTRLSLVGILVLAITVDALPQ